MKFTCHIMRIADFLYRRLGLNIYKAAPNLRAQTHEHHTPALSQIASEKHEAPLQHAAPELDVIHIGPRGGRYKFDSKGRNIYLKAG